MKNLIFEIINQNWGMIGPASWNNTVYKIYDDLSIEIANNYSNSEVKVYNTKMELSDFDMLKSLFNDGKKIHQKVRAFDGEAWEFIYYIENKVYWKRDMDYIYDIEVFENIVKILKKYINNLN